MEKKGAALAAIFSFVCYDSSKSSTFPTDFGPHVGKKEKLRLRGSGLVKVNNWKCAIKSAERRETAAAFLYFFSRICLGNEMLRVMHT